MWNLRFQGSFRKEVQIGSPYMFTVSILFPIVDILSVQKNIVL